MLLFSLVSLSAWSHNHEPDKVDHGHSYTFVKNKKQWPDKIQYAADIPAGKVYLENDRLTYTFGDMDAFHDRYFHGQEMPAKPKEYIDCHAFEVKFLGSDGPESAEGFGKRTAYHNYYLGKDQSRWASKVPLFDGVYYTNIYPEVDFRMYGYGDALKYDFIVQPGGSHAAIRMDYNGHSGLSLKGEALKIRTSVNTLIEEKPYAYQEINGVETEVPCRFVLDTQNDIVSFEFPNGYDTNYPLIIDPTLIFSTYTGSSADNFGYTATYDQLGNLYAGGIVFGIGYPSTVGAYQVNFRGGGSGGAWTMSGGIDVSISKFGAVGTTLLYATYLGGSDNEQPHSLVCNDQNDLYIYGTTYSNNFPTSSNAYDPTYNGSADMFVTRLSENGSNLMGSTYIGGSGLDGVNINATSFSASSLKQNYGDDSRGDIATFANGACVVASCTQSNNFPATPGAVQTAFGGGTQDAVVFKFNPDLSTLVWATYSGGSANDAAYTVEIDQNNGVYFAGGTESNNYPTTVGALQGSNAGGIDGFISHLNSSANGFIKSTYIGTSAYDQVYFLELDNSDNVYVLGQTSGAWTVTAGVYSNPNSGQFVTKLNPLLNNIIYSTIVGNGSGSPNISPTAFLVDVCEYVYISGWGGSVNSGFIGGTTNGMPTTPNALQSTTDGSDLHIMVLRKDAVALDYATYMGGTLSAEHVDGGTSRFNKRAEIYQAVCAGCWSNSDFPTSNAYSTTNNSSGCNLAAFKIEFPLPGILADFTPDPDTGGCAPHTVNFINNSIGGVNFYWEFGDGFWSVANSPTHTYTTPGTYTVMLVAIDPASCNQYDTTYQTINVYAPPAASTIPDTIICDGDGVNLNGSGGQTYQWSPATGLSATNVANPFANPTTTTTYTLIAANPGGCFDTTDVTITVIPSPTATAGPDTSICPGDNVQLTGTGGGSYSWSPATGLNNPNIANPIASPTTNTTYTLTVTALNGCTDEATATINIYNVTANAGADVDLCEGESAQLNATGGTIYSWSPSTGLSNPNIANPVASPANTTTYVVTVQNAAGCPDTDTLVVNVFPVPVVDAGPDETICLLENATLTASGANTYTWSPTNGLSAPNSATTSASPAATTTYTVTGANQFGCTDSDDVTVTVLPLPPVDAGPGAVICQDSLIMLTGSGAVTYNWSPAAGLSSTNVANPLASPNTTTTYTLTGTGANGCTASDTVTVTVTLTPSVTVTDYVSICEGTTIRLMAQGGDSIVWSTGESGFSILVNPTQTTQYTALTYINGCPSLPDTATVEVYDIFPTAAFDATPDSGFMPLTVNFDNQSSGASSYYWYFGNGQSTTEFEPVYTYNEFGDFEVMLIATNTYGCQDTAYHDIIVTGDFGIFVPNAFTPNGDGVNDFFNTPHYGVKDYHIMLFDRWGMMIYESFDPDFQWDGLYKNEDCQEGVYTFVIKANGYLGQSFTKAGTVTLYR